MHTKSFWNFKFLHYITFRKNTERYTCHSCALRSRNPCPGGLRPTHSSLIESQSPSRIGALLWIVIVIWSSPSHPPLLAASCAHRLPARLGLASHTYPPRWHAVRHGFVFLGASLLYYSCCMRDETGEHASWDRHPMQSHVMGSQATRANNPGSSTPFYFTLHADLKPYQLLLFYHWRKK